MCYLLDGRVDCALYRGNDLGEAGGFLCFLYLRMPYLCSQEYFHQMLRVIRGIPYSKACMPELDDDIPDCCYSIYSNMVCISSRTVVSLDILVRLDFCEIIHRLPETLIKDGLHLE